MKIEWVVLAYCVSQMSVINGAVVNRTDGMPASDRLGPLLEDIQAQYDVDLKRFSGVWYEVYRTMYVMESAVRYFEAGSDGTFTAYFTGTKNGTCQPVRKAYCKPRCLGEEAVYLTRLTSSIQTPWAHFRLLYTDYRVALLYFCMTQWNGRCLPHQTLAVILVRRGESDLVGSSDVDFLKELLHNQTGITPSELIPTKMEDDCFSNIQETIGSKNGEDRNECGLSNIEAAEINPDNFKGLWYPTRISNTIADHRLRHVLSVPRCYKFTDKGDVRVSFVSHNDEKCESIWSLQLQMRCPGSGRAEVLIPGGLSLSKGHPVYSIGKVMYVDNDVAVLHGCSLEQKDQTCDPRSATYSVLSRDTELSPEQRELTNEVLRNNCADLETMIDLSQKGTTCECDDLVYDDSKEKDDDDDDSQENDDDDDDDDRHDSKEKDNENDDDSKEKDDDDDDDSKEKDESSQGCPEQRPGPQFHISRTLGLWYYLAGSKLLKRDALKDRDSLISYNKLASRDSIEAMYFSANNGVCAHQMTSTVEERCPGDESGKVLGRVTFPKATSWYSNRFIYVDEDLMISAWCGGHDCDTLNPDLVHVSGRTPTYDNATQEWVATILQSYCLDPDILIASSHTVDCTGHLFVDENVMKENETEMSCKVDDIPTQENFTASEFVGTWHVISTYNHQNMSSTSIHSGILYYRPMEDGLLEGFFSGKFQQNTSSCVPPTRIRMYPQCKSNPEENMWQIAHTVTSNPKPDTISGTWKVIYTDYQSAVVYVCQREHEDGTCDLSFIRISIVSRTWDVDEDDMTFLEDQVAKSCVDVTKLWRTAQESDCFGEIDMLIN